MKKREPKRKSAILIEYFKEHSKECRQTVRTSFLSEAMKSQRLRKALEYYFSYWNDYVHPGFFSLAYETSGGRYDEMIKPQAAIAMMGAALDIHDDIIDESSRKHDHLTVFGKFGEDVCLLLGDAFLIGGFSLLSESAIYLPDEEKKEVFNVAKERLFEVGTAHALELETKHKLNVPSKKYLRVLRMKAAMVEADMQIAAMMARGSDKQIKAFKEYGRAIGILATLREEFVDVFEPEELNRRIQKETLPIPLMCALEEPDASGETMALLKKGKMTAKDVSRLASIILETEPVVRLRNSMEELCKKAVTLAHTTLSRKTQMLPIYLAQSMLEDL